MSLGARRARWFQENGTRKLLRESSAVPLLHREHEPDQHKTRSCGGRRFVIAKDVAASRMRHHMFETPHRRSSEHEPGNTDSRSPVTMNACIQM